MGESRTIVAFDQHAASVMAAVLLPGHQTAATHQVSSDVAAIGRFVQRVRRQGPGIASRPTGGMPSSWPCCIERGRARRFISRPSKKRPRGTCCGVGKPCSRTSSVPAIDYPSCCCVMGAGSPPGRRGRNGMPPGSGRSRGSSRRLSRPIVRISVR